MLFRSQAISTLRSLVEADAKDYYAWSDLGMVYFIQKDLEAAETSYTSALTAKPDHVAALVNLGRVRIARKNNEGAIEPLEGPRFGRRTRAVRRPTRGTTPGSSRPASEASTWTWATSLQGCSRLRRAQRPCEEDNRGSRESASSLARQRGPSAGQLWASAGQFLAHFSGLERMSAPTGRRPRNGSVMRDLAP